MEWIEDRPVEEEKKQTAESALAGFRAFIETRQKQTNAEINTLARILKERKDLGPQDVQTLSIIVQNNADSEQDPRPLDFSQLIKELQRNLRARSTVKKFDVLQSDIDALTVLLELSSDIDEEILHELDALAQTVGLYDIKIAMVSMFFGHIKGLKRAAATGDNLVFGGNPGTGKTSIARILGKLMVLLGFVAPRDASIAERLEQTVQVESKRGDEVKQEPRVETFQGRGFITRTHPDDEWSVARDYDAYVLVTSRENFVASFEGQTTLKTIGVLLRALGKMLFIDEAYALVSGRNDEFGVEALNTLVNWIPDLGDARQTVFAVAGYYDRLRDDFFRRNQGLGSRFPNRFFFPNYTPPQLASVFQRITSRIGWTLADIPPSANVEKLILDEYDALSNRVLDDMHSTHQHSSMPEIQEPLLTSSDNPTPTELGQFLVHFFDVFSRVFETGNVRKLQNYIDSITNLWMQSRLGELQRSGALPDAQWLRSLDMNITPQLMFRAMQSMLLELYTGFEADEMDVPNKLRDDQVDAFRERLEKSANLADKLEEIRATLAQLVEVTDFRDTLDSDTDEFITGDGKRRKVRAGAAYSLCKHTLDFETHLDDREKHYYHEIFNLGNTRVLAHLDIPQLVALLREVYTKHKVADIEQKLRAMCRAKREDVLVRQLILELSKYT